MIPQVATRPRPRDRYERHQLVFELTALALLFAVTRSPAKVLVPGLLLLPGIRRTWLAWVHRGLGTRRTLVGALVAAFVAGFPGAVVVATASAALGAIRSARDPGDPEVQ